MNNQSHINESLGSIPAIIIDNNNHRKRWKYIVLSVATLIGAILCGVLYTRWLTIPVKTHVFEAYSLKASDSCNYKVTWNYEDNYGYYSYEAMRKNNINKDSLNYYLGTTQVRIDKIGDNNPNTQIISAQAALHNDALYEELSDDANSFGRNVENYDHIFKVRHQSSEHLKITRHNVNADDNTFSVTGVNDCKLQESNILPYEEKSFIFTNNHDGRYVNIDKNYKKKRYSLFQMLWKMEDISKAYYDVQVYSSYDTCVVNMNFVGDVRVHYRNNSLATIIDDDINKISIKSSHYGHQFFLVNYTDLENLQTIRLFFLAAFFTVCFTTFLKTIISYLWFEIDFILMRKRRKKEDSDSPDDRVNFDTQGMALEETGENGAVKDDENLTDD